MSNFMRDFADKSYLKTKLGRRLVVSTLISGQADRNDDRIQEAIDQMDSKYLCHPNNQVKRITRRRFIR